MASMEREFLEWLRPRLPGHPQVIVGCGDDAAVLASSPTARFVVTTDALTEGVDFRLAVDSPERIGRKALAVNLSDLAAMGASPVAAFVSLVLPRANAAELARQLLHGMLPLAREFKIAIAGGDTNTWDGPLVVNVMAIGESPRRGPLLRSGGQPGDWIIATGRFGGSLLGRQFDFTPRVAAAAELADRFDIHAAIDVSDGLSLDLSRLAQASRCGAELDLAAIPIAPAAYVRSVSPGDLRTPLEHALADGEDFELLFAVPPAVGPEFLAAAPADLELTRIGQLIREPGLWSGQPDGSRIPLPPRGYEHQGASGAAT